MAPTETISQPRITVRTSGKAHGKRSVIKKKTLKRGDLLYHSVHGLCRVDNLANETRDGKKVSVCTLVPKVATKMKVRFVMPCPDLEIAGFHEPISEKGALKVLEYLKTGGSSDPEVQNNFENGKYLTVQNNLSDFAAAVLFFSRDGLEARDQRKRQILEKSARGLVGELSLAFNAPLKETAEKVCKSLGGRNRLNSAVMTALDRAAED